ncbi:Putative porin [Solimonas aquatica]|uniref:Putative porin n=1 Tax=Solimonas aquatica TaxID=489703 RepID=A0A1H9DMK6_9GAMM|nr:putative porin [Solimonas aquatica]SEQ14547.1 Putative porin [Solimonas aquatica]
MIDQADLHVLKPRQGLRLLAACASLCAATLAQAQPLPQEQTPAATPDLQMSDFLGESAPPPAAPLNKPATESPDKTAGDKDKAVRVPYLSEQQREEIKKELRDEILATAAKENWAQPEALPAWVRRTRIEGEILLRMEADLMDKGNGAQFFNFQAINSGAPVNFTPPSDPSLVTVPFLNTTQNRTIPKLRAKLGLSYTLSDPMVFNFRLATGNGGNPVSTNQTLGTSFNKPQVLIDRAYVHYQMLAALSFDGGRAPNPFTTGTDLIWDRDLSFDGLGGRYRYSFSPQRSLQLALGAYSVENTDLNYASNGLSKYASRDKWLLGAQLEWRGDLFKEQMLRVGAGFYDFTKVVGKFSSQCQAPGSANACSTDDSRPAFVQKGNTMFALRNLQVQNENEDPTYQYFGLASQFRVLSLSASWDAPLSETVRVALDADYARNLTFSPDKIRAQVPVNNLGPCANASSCTAQQAWEGGGNAYQAQLRLGRPKLQRPGDWQAQFGYRYVQSDALLDAFTDSDFHLGGSNAQGYYVGGSFTFAPSATLGARYLSATEITGPKLSIDVLQIDLAVRF